MMEKKIAMIEALANNQEFVASITGTESEEEMISVMAAYGIEMSTSERKAFLAQITTASGDELNEDMLDGVSGGRIWNWIKNCLNNWFNNQSKKNADAIGDILSGL